MYDIGVLCLCQMGAFSNKRDTLRPARPRVSHFVVALCQLPSTCWLGCFCSAANAPSYIGLQGMKVNLTPSGCGLLKAHQTNPPTETTF
jgi:hypothetical protein